MRIPVAAPYLYGEERRAVNAVVGSGWISSSGPVVRRFGDEFSRYCERPYGVGCSSGTTALHLALRCLGVGPGDEVIIPDFTMIAVAYAVLYCGATPVLASVEPDTGNLDPERLAVCFSRRTKAVIAVHTYGHPCDMDAVLHLSRRRRVPVIEDAAEAHGARYRGRRCGGMADIGVFSFYANKIVTTGEGGMLVTSSRKIAERARYLRDLCFTPGRPHDFRHAEIGHNYRLSALQSAVGVAQLGKISETLRRKKAVAAFYRRGLAGLPGLSLPTERDYAESVFWMFGLRLDASAPISRDTLLKKLAADGIETRVFFHPMHRQACLKGRFRAPSLDRRTSRRLSDGGLCLPCGAGLSQRELAYVVSAVRAAWGWK